MTTRQPHFLHTCSACATVTGPQYINPDPFRATIIKDYSGTTSSPYQSSSTTSGAEAPIGRGAASLEGRGNAGRSLLARGNLQMTLGFPSTSLYPPLLPTSRETTTNDHLSDTRPSTRPRFTRPFLPYILFTFCRLATACFNSLVFNPAYIVDFWSHAAAFLLISDFRRLSTHSLCAQTVFHATTHHCGTVPNVLWPFSQSASKVVNIRRTSLNVSGRPP